MNSNFNDDNEMGKLGENDFAYYANTFLSKKHAYFKLVDVSEDKVYQVLDIDFVAYIDPNYTEKELLRDIKSGNPKKIHNRIENKAIAIEVKTDKRTHDTRNVVYELISHDMPGCLARSYADLVYCVCMGKNDTKDNFTIFERFAIDLHKWRTWIRENSRSINGCDSPIFFKSINKEEDHICNLLCKIETMVRDGIANRISF